MKVKQRSEPRAFRIAEHKENVLSADGMKTAQRGDAILDVGDGHEEVVKRETFDARYTIDETSGTCTRKSPTLEAQVLSRVTELKNERTGITELGGPGDILLTNKAGFQTIVSAAEFEQKYESARAPDSAAREISKENRFTAGEVRAWHGPGVAIERPSEEQVREAMVENRKARETTVLAQDWDRRNEARAALSQGAVSRELSQRNALLAIAARDVPEGALRALAQDTSVPSELRNAAEMTVREMDSPGFKGNIQAAAGRALIGYEERLPDRLAQGLASELASKEVAQARGTLETVRAIETARMTLTQLETVRDSAAFTSEQREAAGMVLEHTRMADGLLSTTEAAGGVREMYERMAASEHVRGLLGQAAQGLSDSQIEAALGRELTQELMDRGITPEEVQAAKDQLQQAAAREGRDPGQVDEAVAAEALVLREKAMEQELSERFDSPEERQGVAAQDDANASRQEREPSETGERGRADSQQEQELELDAGA